MKLEYSTTSYLVVSSPVGAMVAFEIHILAMLTRPSSDRGMHRSTKTTTRDSRQDETVQYTSTLRREYTSKC